MNIDISNTDQNGQRTTAQRRRVVENLSVACRILAVTSRLSTRDGDSSKSTDEHEHAIDGKSTENRRVFHPKTRPSKSTQIKGI
jgi:hypothetical protein